MRLKSIALNFRVWSAAFSKIIHDDGSTFANTFGTKILPTVNNATMGALVEAAHRRGKLVVVHVMTEQQARDAISAGADGLAHMFVGETVSPDFGQFVACQGLISLDTDSESLLCD
jgi:hypothetical protein